MVKKYKHTLSYMKKFFSRYYNGNYVPEMIEEGDVLIIKLKAIREVIRISREEFNEFLSSYKMYLYDDIKCREKG